MSEGEGAPDGVRGILFAHGRMAEGMVDAVRRISGVGEDALVPLSNEGMGPEGLRAAVDALAGSSPALVFTDLHSGSCASAALGSCRARKDRAVIAGTNLPMLLDFVFQRQTPLEELVPRLITKGREGMRTLCAPSDAPPAEPASGADRTNRHAPG